MHTAPLVALDWSDDGAVLQSDWCVASSRPLHLWVAGPLLTQRYDGSLPRLRSARGEHLFWDTRTCAQLDAASAAQCVWASASCTHQWALKGVPEVLGARGLLGCTRRSHGGSALACAGLDGALTLVGYPSVSPDAAALRYADGCAPIKARALRIQPRELLLPLLPRCRCDGSCCMWPADAVRSICTRQALSWAGDDGVLLTLSSRGELFQWKHLGGEPNAASAASAASAAADEAAYDSDIENELTHSSAASAHALFAPPQPAEQSSATAAWAGGASADADGTLSLIWGGATDGAPAGVGGSRVGAHHADLHVRVLSERRRARGAARRVAARVGVRLPRARRARFGALDGERRGGLPRRGRRRRLRPALAHAALLPGPFERVALPHVAPVGTRRRDGAGGRRRPLVHTVVIEPTSAAAAASMSLRWQLHVD
jgi:hypothetical protein